MRNCFNEALHFRRGEAEIRADLSCQKQVTKHQTKKLKLGRDGNLAASWIGVLVLTICCNAALFAQVPDDSTVVSPQISGDSTIQEAVHAQNGAATPDAASGGSDGNAVLPASSLAPSTAPEESKGWNWKASTIETLEFTMFDHVWRAIWDPSLRYLLAHKPFYHDWFKSYGGYDLKRWSDGDDFVVNDVGHPLQGAVTSRLFLINNPRSLVPISKNRNYWVPLGQSMIWSAIWQVEWKVGPLSETSFGNAGGWTYVPDCGTDRSCLNNPKYPKPPTNNTGLTDWVLSPLIGGVWVIAEDTLDRYVVAPVARNHRILGGRVLRAVLEPSRDFAALFAGKLVWQLPQSENNYVTTSPSHVHHAESVALPYDHWEIGIQYTHMSLPVLTEACSSFACRSNLSALGSNFDYNFVRRFAFDSSVNYVPAQQGSRAMVEGLFGMKFGARFRHIGIFGKVRPGFIYYESALPGGGVKQPENLTRFAADAGGIFEVYPTRNTTLRFDVGTTLVRYLTDHTDPRTSPIGSLLSNQYIVTQGNFQISTGYTYRF